MQTQDGQSLRPVTNEDLLKLARATQRSEVIRLVGDRVPNGALDLQALLDRYREGWFDERLIEEDPSLAPEAQLQALRLRLREVAGRGIVATVVTRGDEAVLLLAAPTGSGSVPIPPDQLDAA